MGQKIHPGGLRVGVIHDWKSNWYTGAKEFPAYIIEDVKIRDHIYGKLGHAGLSDILIRKDKQRITIDIYTARPGIVIGKSGAEVDALRREVHGMTHKNVQININEIKRPELDAKLVAQSIAEQLQNRVSFRRAMKRSLASAIRSGAKGVKIHVRRPPGRRGDVALGDLLGGPRAAAHAARRHRLRLRRGEDDVRAHRRQGLDQQGRDHARGLRRGRAGHRRTAGRAGPGTPPRRSPRRPRPRRPGRSAWGRPRGSRPRRAPAPRPAPPNRPARPAAPPAPSEQEAPQPQAEAAPPEPAPETASAAETPAPEAAAPEAAAPETPPAEDAGGES